MQSWSPEIVLFSPRRFSVYGLIVANSGLLAMMNQVDELRSTVLTIKKDCRKQHQLLFLSVYFCLRFRKEYLLIVINMMNTDSASISTFLFDDSWLIALLDCLMCGICLVLYKGHIAAMLHTATS